ncbi:hypothetical protein WJX84_010689 [Apatococcus fuscideae]|uniref:EamA domain-containing protein n=1 Tax=Apatococcus fuscideae TaxID=2026836 RepID=A0AAW1TG82_9CHLO
MPTPHLNSCLTSRAASCLPSKAAVIGQVKHSIQLAIPRKQASLKLHRRQRSPQGEAPRGVLAFLWGARDSAAGILNRPAGSQLEAGAELGLISAAANAATLLGFEDTLAARGAFLLRTSVMFTPILAAVAGRQTPRAVWLGAGTAFVGGLLIAGDDLSSQGQHSSSLLSLSGGDAMLIIAALLWALQIVRQGRLAPQYPPIALAANQLGFMALGLGLWLALTAAGDVWNGQSWTAVWPGASNPTAWLIALWPAIFPWGLGGVLQLRAQTMVSPSLTNIVLATDPLWATLFSALLGTGEQRLGFQGWLGGAAIVLACITASQGESSPAEQKPGNV